MSLSYIWVFYPRCHSVHLCGIKNRPWPLTPTTSCTLWQRGVASTHTTKTALFTRKTHVEASGWTQGVRGLNTSRHLYHEHSTRRHLWDCCIIPTATFWRFILEFFPFGRCSCRHIDKDAPLKAAWAAVQWGKDRVSFSSFNPGVRSRQKHETPKTQSSLEISSLGKNLT